MDKNLGIGETFSYKNKTYKVVETGKRDLCKKCSFENDVCWFEELPSCSPCGREDNKEVSFVEVNNGIK